MNLINLQKDEPFLFPAPSMYPNSAQIGGHRKCSISRKIYPSGKWIIRVIAGLSLICLAIFFLPR